MYPNVTVVGATPALRRGVLQLTHTVLRLQKAPPHVSMGITFVEAEDMCRINAMSRGIDAPTDVLTFSQSSKEDAFVNALLFASPEEDDHDGGHSGCSDETQRAALLSLGDVYVCIDYMWRRCCARPTLNLPLTSYLAAALVHGELHALGYDHTTPDELREMVKREQFIGWQLHSQARRHPWTLTPLDPLEYVRDRRHDF